MLRIAVLVSGSGSNLQAIIDAIESKELEVKLRYVVADRPCTALERAMKAGVEVMLIDRKQVNFSNELSKYLGKNVDMIVLAGFLTVLTEDFCNEWKDRIINIHPSLLPKYGGEKMYGLRVHEAVINNSEKITGATVHYVTKDVDQGKIIMQRSVDVPEGITSIDLQKKVLHEVEHKIIVDAINKISMEWDYDK